MHRHKWKIIDKHEQPSTIEEFEKAGVSITGKGLWPNQLIELAKKSVIVTRACEECGTEEVIRI